MVANPERRARIADAAIDILGTDGSRGLTHRAVDRRAQLPPGTSANYFPTRAALLEGVAERCFERVAPGERRLDELAHLDESAETFGRYVAYIVERLIATPALALTLIELRLEAARSPGVAERLGPFLRRGLESDVAFHVERGLPGGREEIVALHHLVNGIVLDHLTVPLVPGSDPAVVAAEVTRRLVDGGWPG